MTFKHVLCLAGISNGAGAMREARRIAERHRAVLTFLYLVPGSEPVGVLFPGERQQRVLDKSRMIASSGRLTEHVVRATGLGERDFHLVVETGSIDQAVIATARDLECDLIVIPAPVPCEKILRNVDCAIFVAREEEGQGVLAATDLSDPSFPALTAGEDVARLSGQSLTGMFSLSFADTTSFGLGSELTAYRFSDGEMEEMTKNVRGQLRQAMRSVHAEGDVLVEQGPAVDAILRAASRLHSRLIVVGSHRRGALPRLLLGSVSESVARRAPCSVLVMKGHESHAPEAA